MSKIKIKATLKYKDEKHIFEGYGIKKDNQIIYNDENVQTKITIDNIICIERKSDYFIKINLKEGINLPGLYITNYGNFSLKSKALKIKYTENELEIIYKLMINEELLDTFSYNLKFSLDT